MIVFQSSRARRDLEDVYKFGTARYGANAAALYVEEIVAVYRFMSEWPLASPEYKDVKPPVRVRVFRGHIIVYRVEAGRLEIIRLLSRFQNWRDHV